MMPALASTAFRRPRPDRRETANRDLNYGD